MVVNTTHISRFYIVFRLLLKASSYSKYTSYIICAEKRENYKGYFEWYIWNFTGSDLVYYRHVYI